MDDYVLRSPRHPSPGTLVEVLRAPGGLTNVVEAELINLSREGFQLRLPIVLDDQELVIMRITTPGHGVDAIFPATVRWQREELSGDWLAGCKTSWQIDLETLGELFLNEILTANPQ